MSATPPSAPGWNDVREASRRLAGVAHRTPVMRSRRLDAQLGAQLFFKCENLQRTGAFKFRGAYNAIAQLGEAQRRRGVVTYSSGNHAQAVALSARLLDTPAAILMPADTPSVKVDATRGYGAQVEFYDRLHDDRQAMAAQWVHHEGRTLIPPFDHPHVIAGQGTAAQELMEEMGELDVLLTTLGGGGLLAGTALAARGLSPKCRVIGVEPTASDDGLRSLRAGHIVHIAPPQALPEGALGTHVGELNFAVMRQHVHDVWTVDDAPVIDAMKLLARQMKLVVEPTGALPLAALLDRSRPIQGLRVGLILSGGNVDLTRFARLLTE